METYHYILIAFGLILLVVIPVIITKRKSHTKKDIELPIILELLDKLNIESAEFIRNKIVITFKDVTLFDTEKLHEKGAKGISIVGEKVKFYFDGDNNLNEKTFYQIKQYIEG